MPADTVPFTMPSLGADMDEGKLSEWLVAPGDHVARGDIVAVVETSKAAIEVECFHSGVVDQLLVDPGTVVAVGEPLARLRLAGAEAVPAGPPAPPSPATPQPPATPPSAAGPLALSLPAGPLIRRLAHSLHVDLGAVHGTGRGGVITREDVRRAAAAPTVRTTSAPPADVRVSPYAARLAAQLGVDLGTVRGTGRDSAVRVDDVRAAAATPSLATAAAPVEAPAVTAPPTRNEAMRQAIARLMARSKREIPHYYESTSIDVTGALAWVRERNRELPVDERILPAALFLGAVAAAAVAVPELNGTWEDDRFVPGPAVNLGVAVALRGGGLATPVIADAASMDLVRIAARLRDVATRAKAGRLRGSEVSGATITVTNLGDLGVETVYGVIYPPQVALVGVGRPVDRPWSVDGLLGVRTVVTVTLSADHRATDGHSGAMFLAAMSRAITRPDALGGHP